METLRDFMFGGSKITADGDYGHEIKRCLLLGKNNYDQPRQYIKKQRYYFTKKAHLVKAMFFLLFTYECENWTIKTAEH